VQSRRRAEGEHTSPCTRGNTVGRQWELRSSERRLMVWAAGASVWRVEIEGRVGPQWEFDSAKRRLDAVLERGWRGRD
jgi:hypothetical protein